MYKIILLLLVIIISDGLKIKLKTIVASFIGIGLSTQLPISQSLISQSTFIQTAYARKLPTSNDAKGDKRGKLEALIPIIKMEQQVKKALNDLPNVLNIDLDLNQLPLNEKEFKRLFDEYSEAVSYKQIFMVSNDYS